MVAARDGAYSVFDTSKVVDGFNPISGLKTFLNLFVDETSKQAQRRSTTEDDHPPSPMGMDTMDSFMAQAQTGRMGGSPSTLRGIKQDVSKLHNNPMTPPSNPNTPASPRIGQVESSQVAPVLCHLCQIIIMPTIQIMSLLMFMFEAALFIFLKIIELH